MALDYLLVAYVAVGSAVALAFVIVGVTQVQPMPVTVGTCILLLAGRIRALAPGGCAAVADETVAPGSPPRALAGSGRGGRARIRLGDRSRSCKEPGVTAGCVVWRTMPIGTTPPFALV